MDLIWFEQELDRQEEINFYNDIDREDSDLEEINLSETAEMKTFFD